MTTTYRLNTDELTMEVLNSIKSAFKNKTIDIVVTEVADETGYLLSSDANKAAIYQSIQEIEDGKGITFSVQELQEKYGTK